MKKTYIAPELSTDLNASIDMICVSLGMAGNAYENGVTEADAKGRFADESFGEESTGWKDGLW